MSEAEKAYSEHWDHCSDCQHQSYCETGWRFREALRNAERE